jgi:hypothetical protein
MRGLYTDLIPRHAKADAAAIGRATEFQVVRFIGRGRYEEIGVFPTLDATRAARAAAGRDEYGRTGMICAGRRGGGGMFMALAVTQCVALPDGLSLVTANYWVARL